MVHSDDVLRFWFGRPPGRDFGLVDAAWLPSRIPCWGGHWARKVLDVDALIEARFGTTLVAAAAGELDHWSRTPAGRLALVIVLDQFSRNIYRATPRAFEQDQQGLALALAALEQGEDRLFNELARTLFYLPLMHQEQLELQQRCIALYEAAYAQAPLVPRLVLKVELASARRHRDIIARFGRFSHRNGFLGRDSTAEEVAFLQQPFSSF